MKRLLAAVFLIAVAAAGFAAPRGPHHPYAYGGVEVPPYLEQELQSLLEENASSPIGSLTGAQLKSALERLSVAVQKEAFVARSKSMSFVLPGLGQMVNKDYTSGTLFLLADIALLTGTVLGTYFLLPAEVRFDRLDYIHDPYTAIRDAWEGRSFSEFLPSLAALVGGGLSLAILGGVSSEHAGRLAERNIAEGRITFEPKLIGEFLPGGRYGGPGGQAPGSWRMGWGMGMRY